MDQRLFRSLLKKRRRVGLSDAEALLLRQQLRDQPARS
jgi:hypothetical protein